MSISPYRSSGGRICAGRLRRARYCDLFHPTFATFARHSEENKSLFKLVTLIIAFFSEPFKVQLTPDPNRYFDYTDRIGTAQQKRNKSGTGRARPLSTPSGRALLSAAGPGGAAWWTTWVRSRSEPASNDMKATVKIMVTICTRSRRCSHQPHPQPIIQKLRSNPPIHELSRISDRAKMFCSVFLRSMSSASVLIPDRFKDNYTAPLK